MFFDSVNGVYHLRHILTEQVFSGMTNNFAKQQDWHHGLLCDGLHKSRKCQELFNKSGNHKDFAFEIEVCQNLEQAERVLLIRLREARTKKLTLNETKSPLTKNKGVYKVAFPNGFVWIGESRNIHRSIQNMEWKLAIGRHPNIYMQQIFEYNHGEYVVKIMKESYADAIKRFEQSPKMLNLLWERHSDPKTVEALLAALPERNKFARPIFIDGITYPSFRVAVDVTRMPFQLINKRLKKDPERVYYTKPETTSYY
ncbi:hypothetical protein [Pseudomonas phage D6]|nr:hypothetical protein [Pseudomonas phage D6]